MSIVFSSICFHMYYYFQRKATEYLQTSICSRIEWCFYSCAVLDDWWQVLWLIFLIILVKIRITVEKKTHHVCERFNQGKKTCSECDGDHLTHLSTKTAHTMWPCAHVGTHSLQWWTVFSQTVSQSKHLAKYSVTETTRVINITSFKNKKGLTFLWFYATPSR